MATETDSPSTGRIVLVLVRSVVTIALLVFVYSVAPLRPQDNAGTAVLFFAGFTALIVMIGWQLRAIVVKARYPGLRAVEAFASSISLFLLLFAATYVVIEAARPGMFSQPLTRIDALYFTITVFATVGFGDITPVGQTARMLVTIQMVADLLVLGLLVNSIIEAVRRGRSRRGTLPHHPAPEEPTP
ncbi:potassium channel family protein [Actinomycetospora lutea]|uniref:potassium channel family protein n=1 Tax=Actinomycetospora lutea TaxID=663604 RepID=UPI002366422E|nr:potassium channel family protein [Actinomycetospora lutea]MDD7942378.1 potassium channel family protein [Actinomycetospora lutea]